MSMLEEVKARNVLLDQIEEYASIGLFVSTEEINLWNKYNPGLKLGGN